MKRRHAHPLVSRLEKDYLTSPTYHRSSPNLYQPDVVSGVCPLCPRLLWGPLWVSPLLFCMRYNTRFTAIKCQTLINNTLSNPLSSSRSTNSGAPRGCRSHGRPGEPLVHGSVHDDDQLLRESVAAEDLVRGVPLCQTPCSVTCPTLPATVQMYVSFFGIRTLITLTPSCVLCSYVRSIVGSFSE